MSARDLLERAEKIERKISKLNGKAKKKAQMQMYHLRHRAKKLKLVKPIFSPKALKTYAAKVPAAVDKAMKRFDKNQGILPGFLNQISNMRIEELVAEKIFNALKIGVSRAQEVTAPAEDGSVDVVPDFSKTV